MTYGDVYARVGSENTRETHPVPFPRLTFRQRLTYWAHLSKALTRQHHAELRGVFEELLPRDGVVLDIGAHAGQFTKLFAGLVPDGRVLAFEPSSYARRILSTAVLAKQLRNVAIVPVGLSDSAGQLELAMPLKASGSLGYGLSHFGGEETRTSVNETVEIMTLDGYLSDAPLDRIDLVKADIEGWEASTLR